MNKEHNKMRVLPIMVAVIIAIALYFIFLTHVVNQINENDEKQDYCYKRAVSFLNKRRFDKWTKKDTLKVEMGGVFSEYKPYGCKCKYIKKNGTWQIYRVLVVNY